MQIKWLEDFVTLAAEGSFTRAAEQRHVARPAFGRRIGSLESAVGIALVDRSSAQFRLTAEGRRFLETAAQTVATLDAAKSALKARKMPAGQLVVVTGRTLSHTLLPAWLAQIHARAPAVGLKVITASLQEATLLLMRGKADVMLAYAHPKAYVQLDADRFPFSVVARERLLPVCQPDAAGKPRFRLNSKTSPAPLLAFSTSLALGRVLDHHLQRNARRYKLKLVAEVDFADTAYALAVRGLGIAWVPQSMAQVDIAAGRLAIAGSGDDEIVIDVRLYRDLASTKPLHDWCT